MTVSLKRWIFSRIFTVNGSLTEIFLNSLNLIKQYFYVILYKWSLYYFSKDFHFHYTIVSVQSPFERTECPENFLLKEKILIDHRVG